MDVLLIMFGGIVLFFVVPWVLMGCAVVVYQLVRAVLERF